MSEVEAMNHKSITSQAPGRINIIGEHTDYNEGFVLPAAIDKKTVFTLKENGTKDRANIHAIDVAETYSFSLNNFQPIEAGWQNYVMGVVSELQKLGANLPGFDGQFEGNVPIGGGMSSSAALTCSLAYGLNELFALGLDKWQLIKAAQMAEHNFAKTKCGIMDQFASMMGKQNQVMLLDCRSLEFSYFPFDLGDYQLLLLNTNVTHSLAASGYNTRRDECELGVSTIQKSFPHVKSLRDVSLEMLQQCREAMPATIFKRCQHIITENARVLEATVALKKKDFQRLGDLMYQSHQSLQDDYAVSCPELDYLVHETRDKDYILGSRMMGGGFGGCTLSIIEKKQAARFIALAADHYRKQFGMELSPYSVSIENGAESGK